MTLHITINFDALPVTIGGHTMTGSASVIVPVTSEQLIVLLQSGTQTAAAAPIQVSPQPTIAAPAPIAPVEAPVAVPEQPVVDPVPAPVEPEPVPEAAETGADQTKVRKRRRGVLSSMSDDDIHAAFNEAGSAIEAARMLGVSEPNIYVHRKRLGYEFPPRQPKTREVAGTKAKGRFQLVS
ncbi:hypothetical protein [Devosia submarina]|uniref:hypothetical protein n=1 Tax=Devosia submarina TaxID=1173082 RepID=UPI000D3A4451|nr:hypothetical protein [Devosia submarina]